LIGILEKESIKLISSFIGKDLQPVVDNLKNMETNNLIATFSWSNDGYNFFNGFVSGMINVLPDGSFLKYCRNNITSVDTGYSNMINYWSTDKTKSLTGY
jgi:hypothetical protein